MNEIVKFPTNTPVEVTLQVEEGKRVEGRYGEQVMYSLLDDRVMYVPPYVAQRFQELAIGAGEPLLICKQKVKDGNRERTEWSVKRAPQQPQLSVNGTGGTDSAVLNIAQHGGDALEEPVNGAAKQEEQPSANSTAPMAQELEMTNTQHQRQDSAPGPRTEIMLASVPPSQLSTKESVYMPAMTLEVALARRAAIVEFVRRLMVRDQDFGEIPGTSKPTLLKPGAEKLCNFFGLEPEFLPIVEDIDWTGEQHEGELFCYARYHCRLVREGRVVGVGEGSCNSWEAKYRYRWVEEEQVPAHLDRARLMKRVICADLVRVRFRRRAGRDDRDLWKAHRTLAEVPRGHRNGTARQVEKTTRRGKSVAWEIDIEPVLYRIPNPEIADVVNTIQKMAQKRALVAATLIATSASEFFTQDVEDADHGRTSTRVRMHTERGRRRSTYGIGGSRNCGRTHRPGRPTRRRSRGGTSGRCASTSSGCGSRWERRGTSRNWTWPACRIPDSFKSSEQGAGMLLRGWCDCREQEVAQ